MALKRMVIDGYGQLELNNVAFRRDGRVEAQCALDSGTGASFENVPAENGMLLAVDRVGRKVKFDSDGSLPIALNYTAEHMYDERANGLKDFKLEAGSFYPRLGYLAVGDLFTTNCLAYDTDDFANDAAVVTAAGTLTTAMYGGPCANGAIQVQDSKPSYGPILKAVEKTTMPDGQFALKFQVLEV